VIIGESQVDLQTYDRELQDAIDAAVGKPILRCIDRCLWVYVDGNREKSPQQKIEEFRVAIRTAAPQALPWIDQQFEGKLSFEAVTLETNLEIPEAIPLFLRELKPETIRDVLLGHLMRSVFLFLDWKELTAMVKEQEAEMEWSSFKEGRRQQAKPFAQRLLTIGGRVPRIRFESGNYIEGFRSSTGSTSTVLLPARSLLNTSRRYTNHSHFHQKMIRTLTPPTPTHRASRLRELRVND